MPYHVVVRQRSPFLTDLCGLAEGRSIEETENLVRELGWQRTKEVNADELANVGREIGELGKAALGENALKHEVSLFARRGRKD